LLTVVADRMFGFTVTWREWIGVGLTAAGLAFLAATLDGGADSAPSAASTRPPVAGVGGPAVLGLLLALASPPVRRRGALPRAAGGAGGGGGGGAHRGGLGRVDQGPQRPPGRRRGRRAPEPARADHPRRLADRPRRLGAEPPDRTRGAGHRGDERRREPRHDR